MDADNKNEQKRFQPPISVILFGDDGSVGNKSEDLPLGKSSVELEIVQKFAACLQRWCGRSIVEIQPSPNPNDFPDVYGTEEGMSVGIEVAEAITERKRRWQVIKHSLPETIRQCLREQTAMLAGMMLDVSIQSIPSERLLSTKRGTDIARAISDQLLTSREQVLRLPIGWSLPLQVDGFADKGYIVSVTVERWGLRATPGNEVRINIGGSYVRTSDDKGSPVADTLSKKLGKRYDTSIHNSTILLLYSIDMLAIDGTDVKAYEQLLSTSSVPFNEIWLFCPTIEHTGWVTRMWPLPLKRYGNARDAGNEASLHDGGRYWAFEFTPADLSVRRHPKTIEPDILGERFANCSTAHGHGLAYISGEGKGNDLCFNRTWSPHHTTVIRFVELQSTDQYGSVRGGLEDAELTEYAESAISWALYDMKTGSEELCFWVRSRLIIDRFDDLFLYLGNAVARYSLPAVRAVHLFAPVDGRIATIASFDWQIQGHE